MPTLDEKLQQLSNRIISKKINNAVDRASSNIPNITSGLDIPDNGLIKGEITKLFDDATNSIFKGGLINKTPALINLAGPSYNQSVEYSKPNIHFVKLNTLKDTYKEKPDKKKLEFDVTQKILESTILPFPQNVGITTAPKWDAEAGGAIGEILKNQSKDNSSNIFDKAGSLINNTINSVDVAASAQTNSANAIGNLIGSGNLGKLINGASGKLMNPREVVLFSGIEHRQFSLVFNFGPQSAEEAKTLANYIKSLHNFALPAIDGVYFKYPEYFTFAIVDGNNKTVLDRGEVVINNIECNYTPEGIWATFKDGKPIHIELTLGFMERTLPTRETVATTFGKD